MSERTLPGERDRFFVGMAGTAVFFCESVHPVTRARQPASALPSATIRFRNPDGTILQELTLANAGVTNHGDGHYYATAVFTQEGLHEIEFETGGATPGREKTNVTVEPF